MLPVEKDVLKLLNNEAFDGSPQLINKKINNQWIMGVITSFKHPMISKGQPIHAFIPWIKGSKIFVDKTSEKLIKSKIHSFGLDVTQFQFVYDLWSLKQIRCENGIISCGSHQHPLKSVILKSNIASIYGVEFSRDFHTINAIQSLCSSFPALAVRGYHDDMIQRAQIIRALVENVSNKLAVAVHLEVYQVIALQNESRGYLELQMHYKSIRAYTKAERTMKKFKGDDNRIKIFDPDRDNINLILNSQSSLHELIRKEMIYRKLDYKSPKHKIVPMQKSRYPFYMKSYKALKLRNGRNLKETLERHVRKRCSQCDGIRAKGRNRKCKRCKCRTLFYCSRYCQKKHWKYEHRFECVEAKN